MRFEYVPLPDICFLPIGRIADVVLEIQRDQITATAAISGLGSILFGFLTNLPVALA